MRVGVDQSRQERDRAQVVLRSVNRRVSSADSGDAAVGADRDPAVINRPAGDRQDEACAVDHEPRCSLPLRLRAG